MTTQKETLQPKDIVGYIANGGLKGCSPIYEGNVIVDIEYNSLNVITNKVNYTKPLLYSLDCLTKEIPFNGGKIVPLIECAKVAFSNVNNFKAQDLFAYSEDIGIRFHFSDNGFHAFNLDRRLYLENQHALFQLLYQYKIDFLGLIDKGLAVDVSTLTVNPYL